MFRIRFVRVLLTASILTVGIGVAALLPAAAPGGVAAAAGTGPQCTFNGGSLPLLTGVSKGSKIAISCTGLPALHPYLLVGTSLVLPLDPAAAPLFSGQIVSLAGLMSLLSALKEIDLASAATVTSSLSGSLSTTWTVPTFQALDPNASCPPTQQEFNSGLLGCALAMIDLSSFTPVSAGSALFEYAGFPLFPPNPTVALSATTATPGQSVSISDAAGATTYWWLSTLNVLQGALGGSASTPGVTVAVVDSKGRTVPAVSNGQATPASYNNGVFTPPVLSGNFSVPSTVTGPVTVHVTLTASLDGIPLTNTATAPLFVNNPPTTTVVVPSNGASVAGTTYLDAFASDYGTLTKVEFHLTGGSLNKALVATATPTIYGYLALWNTITVPNGTYVVQSEAFDAAGLSAYSSGVTVTVNNPPPTTTVLSPSGGASVKGTQVLLDASASSGVSQVKYELTGGSLTDSVIATATPTYYGWLAGWNSQGVPDGTYTLQSVASYPGGVSGVSPGVTITVAN